MEEEIWMPVKWYEGIYEVSHFGRVRRVLASKGAKIKILKPGVHISCLNVGLCKNGVVKTKKIHTLVLTAFNCDKPDGMECCHFDGDFKNNYIGNLRWDTTYNNHQDKKRHNTCYRPISIGEYNNNSKLNENDVMKIKSMLSSGVKSIRIAEKYNIQKSAISKIKTGRSWKHII